MKNMKAVLLSFLVLSCVSIANASRYNGGAPAEGDRDAYGRGPLQNEYDRQYTAQIKANMIAAAIQELGVSPSDVVSSEIGNSDFGITTVYVKLRNGTVLSRQVKTQY